MADKAGVSVGNELGEQFLGAFGKSVELAQEIVCMDWIFNTADKDMALILARIIEDCLLTDRKICHLC